MSMSVLFKGDLFAKSKRRKFRKIVIKISNIFTGHAKLKLYMKMIRLIEIYWRAILKSFHRLKIKNYYIKSINQSTMIKYTQNIMQLRYFILSLKYYHRQIKRSMR